MHTNHDICPTCWKNPDYLIIDKKNTSRIVAGMILCTFFVFVAGYFWGKKQVAQDFTCVAEQTNFSDQVSYALNTFQEHNNAQVVESLPHPTELEIETSSVPELAIEKAAENKEHASTRYAAQILGGTKKGVEDFVQRMARRGIPLEMRKRTSTTARGKTMYWYQAVTAPFATKKELEELIDKIKKFEKIDTIQIIQMPS